MRYGVLVIMTVSVTVVLEARTKHDFPAAQPVLRHAPNQCKRGGGVWGCVHVVRMRVCVCPTPRTN